MRGLGLLRRWAAGVVALVSGAALLGAPVAVAGSDQPKPLAISFNFPWDAGYAGPPARLIAPVAQPQLLPPPRRRARRAAASATPRYYYVRTHDEFGNPGRVYRVVGVDPKAQRPSAPRAESRADAVRAHALEQLRNAPVPPPVTGPLMAIVSIAKQRLTLYDAGVPVAQTPVSTGMPDHPTPTGVFAVIEKQWWHRSNIYSAAPMPFMQRITWTGVALHSGALPGYAASHGCIRLPDEFALRLWGTTRLGARIIVSPYDVKPVEIAHGKLFTGARPGEPAPSVPPDLPDIMSMSRDPDAAAVDLAELDDSAVYDLAAETLPTAPWPSPVAAAPKPTPVEPKTTTIAIVRPGRPNEVVEMTAPSDPVREAALQAAEQPPGPTIRITRDGFALEIAVLASVELPADDGAFPTRFAAAKPARASESDVLPPAATPDATPASGLSVFVSRSTGRLSVRNNFKPLFEMPVVIADPSQPIGTHVFTALALKDATNMRWNVVSMPAPSPDAGKRGSYVPQPVTAGPPLSPSAALDRITFPSEAVARIGQLLSVGATLTISDEASYRENGLANDFIVMTR